MDEIGSRSEEEREMVLGLIMGGHEDSLLLWASACPLWLALSSGSV